MQNVQEAAYISPWYTATDHLKVLMIEPELQFGPQRNIYKAKVNKLENNHPQSTVTIVFSYFRSSAPTGSLCLVENDI